MREINQDLCHYLMYLQINYECHALNMLLNILCETATSIQLFYIIILFRHKGKGMNPDQ